jgi:hypothetical protein
MPLPSPNLDDRTFDQLVDQARRRIQRTCPDWTDFSFGNPGIVLLELFAFLTETMLYRLNHVPEKVYIELLRLIGVTLQPPAAASVVLRFRRSDSGDQPIEIPSRTRVASARGSSRAGEGAEPPIFTTDVTATIPAGQSHVDVLAHHCVQVDGELVAVGTGLPGLSATVQNPPIIAATGAADDLVIGVETTDEELPEGAAVIRHRDKIFHVWREVHNLAQLGPDPFVYLVDRMAGLIRFAPAAQLSREDGGLEPTSEALAAVPRAGREIRVWYRHGGGPAGNLAANTLTVLKDPIRGVQVTNPQAATGGQAAETLNNAMVRGPLELHSLERAVTAQDFELIALRSSRGLARARAVTRAALWAHATPGTVEVLLVPRLPGSEESGSIVAAAALQAQETEAARSHIERVLDERRPLGTGCVVSWARYKTVRVSARAVVRNPESTTAVRERVMARLHSSINPLPGANNRMGWPFGQTLHASHIYDSILAEPGVLWVDQVQLMVDEVPSANIGALAVDHFQRDTWYAGSGSILFRSLNNGDGWEVVGRFGEERIACISTHQDRPGLLAVVTRLPDNEGSRMHFSRDCGESWEPTTYTTTFEVNDIAWIMRDEQPILLLATVSGLYELNPEPGSGPVQILVDPQDQDRGFYAVAASRDLRGQISVAVAAQATAGIYWSSDGGRAGTFRHIGLNGHDIRSLEVQYDGPRTFLWAGAAAVGGDTGEGCFRWELRGRELPPEGWQTFRQGWNGGSCRALAFLGSTVLAASHRAGVLRLNTSQREPSWQSSDVRSGLPLRDPGRFYPVDTIAADSRSGWAMAGGVEGVYRSQDGGLNFGTSSSTKFAERVSLPATWLFCSGEHEIEVVTEDEADQN